MPDNPSHGNPKRIASVILWVILFAGIVADSNDKLQSVFRLIPQRFAPYMPILYGAFALAALVLLHFAHKDDLEASAHPVDKNSPTLRERVRLLSAQISKFDRGRSNATPSALSLPMIPSTPQEWNEVSQKTKLYGLETSELYLQRFAPQITLILKELANEGVVDTELNAAYLLNSNLLIGIAEVAERLNTLADRLPLSEATAPDVTLTGTFPGLLFLCASGRACEIRISPIVLESAVVGTMKDGEQTRREVSERYSIEFPVEGDINDGEKKLAIPTVFCGEGYSRSTWPEKESGRSGMSEFFRMAAYIRRVEIGEPDANNSTDAEINDFAERIRQELTFNFDITFWNSDHTQQWKRSELLVHEPTTGTAFVRHTGTPERLVGSVGARP